MTIRKGEAWGAPGALPADGVLVHSDAQAREVVTEARRRGDPIPTLGLLGGDLCRTLGGKGDVERLRSADAMTFPVDLGAALVDGHLHWFVAHLVARRSWWFGRVIAVMNAQWHGRWDLGPRSHPDDGLLDITDATMALGDRWKAWRRLPTGTHLPHPSLRTTRTAAATFDLEPALTVHLDGRAVGRARTLAVRIEPDALTVVV
ncbi:diacylglycerol/lipid kinase family protein [Rhabdothermincola salaria]|uniref:diacylglycerol/lipid kinase family protein n=1 Tax=Rhabdothermincola salaria TaxID=2903142 RepID=UPI001E4CD4D5|nr:hypothetical protein [Rhabdothermincola salaria]MCD9623081.1 hypothetical protein [Rhabdothermincola salaria]